MHDDQQRTFPATIMRGGTSRGVFFHMADLPRDREQWDRVILAALGSPDPYGRQIDGLGGATSSTSKAVVVAPSERPDADVIYTFAQVSVREPRVDWSGNCGNLTAAVATFAIDEGLVAATEPVTKVRLYNTNTNKMIVASVPVKCGRACVAGDYLIYGIPAPGAAITLTYDDPSGSVTGSLLPTGRVIDEIDAHGIGQVTVSVVDAATPVVFFSAATLELTATETAAWIDQHPRLLQRLESIRYAVAERIGLGPPVPEALKVAIVASPATYVTSSGVTIDADEFDIAARIVSVGRAHHAYTVTGAICTAIAALIPGTLVNQQLRGKAPSEVVRIGHPAGTIEIGVEMEQRDGSLYPRRVTTYRTARRIMQGQVYIPADALALSEIKVGA